MFYTNKRSPATPIGSAAQRSRQCFVQVSRRLNNEASSLVVQMVRRTQTTRQIAELEALYKQQFPAFARVAISLTGSVELGKEAVQEAFARAIEQVDGFRGDCPLEAWVWRIVVNTARTSARRAGY